MNADDTAATPPAVTTPTDPALPGRFICGKCGENYPTYYARGRICLDCFEASRAPRDRTPRLAAVRPQTAGRTA